MALKVPQEQDWSRVKPSGDGQRWTSHPKGDRPVGLPAWATAAVLELAAISGTAAPALLKDYSGIAVRNEDGVVQLVAAGPGGHQFDNDNSVNAITLSNAAPVWSTLRSASAIGSWNLTGSDGPNYPDGRPAAKHLYWYTWWVAAQSRIMNFGGRAFGSDGSDAMVTDAFNLATNDWDTAGTFANPAARYSCLDANGDLWDFAFDEVGNTLRWFKLTASTFAQTNGAMTGASTLIKRGTFAYSAALGKFFHLCAGDNFAAPSSTVTATLIDPAGGTCTAITFNSSSAWTAFQAAASGMLCSAITNSADDGAFFFYDGASGQTLNFWKVTHNGTTTWDMSLLGITNSATPGVSNSGSVGGCLTKLIYVAQWRMLILVVPNENIYYIRLA